MTDLFFGFLNIYQFLSNLRNRILNIGKKLHGKYVKDIYRVVILAYFSKEKIRRYGHEMVTHLVTEVTLKATLPPRQFKRLRDFTKKSRCITTLYFTSQR